uniref:Tubulin_C domain-containing protein n=1 Tax=Ascaris lumbricoides TaxID=6252 RepID=A0A0M3IWI5_ASCLU
MALGELGVIRTERRIFEKDNIVISLDNIEDMGEFIDITVSVVGHDNEEEGMKVANENITSIISLQETLGMALGELGVIRTERRIFEKDNIVISLDNIEDMGEFIDITVSVVGHDNEEEGMKVAKSVQAKLGIADDQLIPLSYFDLLMQGGELSDLESELCHTKISDESDRQSISSDSAVYS